MGRSGLLIAIATLLSIGCARLLGLDDLDFSSSGKGGTSAIPEQSAARGGESEDMPPTLGGGGALDPSGQSGSTNEGGGSSGAGGDGQTQQPEVSPCAPDAARPLSCLPSLACAEQPCGGYLWQGGIIPYELANDLPPSTRALVKRAASAWSTGSAVQLSECPDDACATHSRWLRIKSGRQVRLSPSSASGEQTLELPKTASSERVAHELGHVLGLPDLWRRPDRDRYLTLSDAAFCSGDSHWDPSTCSVGAADDYTQPRTRPTGLLGPFETNSAMNLAGPEVCEAQEPDSQRPLPTALDASAAIELYRTADGWSPFAALGREAGNAPLDYSLAPQVTPVGSPALASRGYPEVDLYARGSDQQIYWKLRPYAMGGFGDWTDWSALGCCFDSDPSAVAWSWLRTDLFARRIDGNIAWRTLAGIDLLTWNDWASVGAPAAGAASSPIATSGAPGQLDLFVRGGDDHLYWKHYAGAWAPGWTKLDTEPFVGRPAAAARRNGMLEVVIAMADGDLQHYAFDGAGASGGLRLLDGPIQADTSPSLVTSADVLYLYIVAPSHHLLERIFRDDEWGPWRDLGGVVSSSPAAVGRRARPHVDVAAMVDDNGQTGAWLRSWPTTRACYVGSESCGACAEPCDGSCPHTPEPAGDPVTYRRPGGKIALVSRGSDGHVYRFIRDGGWTMLDLTTNPGEPAFAAGDPTGYVRTDGYEVIIYRSLDGEIAEIASKDERWTYAALATRSNAPDVKGDPKGYARSDGYNSVVYRAIDDHLHELYLWNGGWESTDLTLAVGARNAIGNPLPFVRADSVNSVIYRNDANDFTEVYLNGHWVTAELSIPGSAAAPAGDPLPYVRADGRNAVIYTGTNGHIYELSSAWNEHTWTALDLTDAAGAPTTESDAKAYTRADGLDAVVYRAADQHVHELSRHDDHWVWTDVSSAAAAPLSASRPTPFVRDGDVNAIAYRATDGRLYELAWQSDAWTKTIIYDPNL